MGSYPRTDSSCSRPLDCRKVLAAGQRKVEVRGPYPELEADIVATHEGFW